MVIQYGPKQTIYSDGYVSYRYKTVSSNPWTSGVFTYPAISGEMYSRNNFPLNTDTDDGSAWLMTKNEISAAPGYYKRVNAINNWYDGEYLIAGPTGTHTELFHAQIPSDNAMIAKGTTHISRSIPSNPNVALSTTIGELRMSGVPTLPGLQTLRERTKLAKNAGSEYLNVEFGWKPLVSDLRNLAKSVQSSADLWDQYRKGSHRKTRVGYHDPDVTARKSYVGQFNTHPNHTGRFAHGSQYEDTVVKSWFSGAFRYYVPDPNGNLSEKFAYWKQRASYLYGLELTPDAVWNLSPWSWAIDWFVNTGDLINNISRLATDSMVMQYGYGMAESTHTLYKHGQVVTSAGDFSTTTSTAIVRKRCKRIPATPFGFGVDLSSISPRQAAILVALGLSKSG